MKLRIPKVHNLLIKLAGALILLCLAYLLLMPTSVFGEELPAGVFGEELPAAKPDSGAATVSTSGTLPRTSWGQPLPAKAGDTAAESITAPRSPGQSPVSKEKTVDVMETVTNYDSRMRIGKIIWRGMGESSAAGKETDWDKINDQIWRKSMGTHVVIETTANVAGSALQYACMGVAPPFGLAAASLVNGVVSNMGGAIGYETSVAMEEAPNRTRNQIVGRAMKNIDATNFAARTAGSVAGAVIGQALCPLPFVGAMAGGLVGSVVGGTLGNYFVETEFGKNYGETMQRSWNRFSAWVTGEKKQKNQMEPERIPPLNNSTMPRTTQPLNIKDGTGRIGRDDSVDF